MSSTPRSTCSTPCKITDQKFVNLFTTEVRSRKGSHPWTFASRKAAPGVDPNHADAAVVIAVTKVNGEPHLVLTREFRPPLGGYEISVPSGLIDDGETAADAAAREMREETGMTLTRVIHVSPPLASSAGLTDETVSLVYAEAEGTPTMEHQEQHEDIETWLAPLSHLRELVTRPTDVISSRLYPVLVSFVSAGAIQLPRM